MGREDHPGVAEDQTRRSWLEVGRGREQGTEWYSVTRNEATYHDIKDMAPNHAYNAWATLRRLYEGTWEQEMNSPLAVALLRQALGEQAWDKAFGESVGEPQPFDEILLFNRCFDALQVVNPTATAAFIIRTAAQLTSDILERNFE